MSLRNELRHLGAGCVVALALYQACTDNTATRVLDAGASGGSGGDAGSGGVSSGGVAGNAVGGTGGTSSGSGGGGTGGSGPLVDPCLPECDDPEGCELSPTEQAEVDFCYLYQARCPDQPSDVMMERGFGQAIPKGPDVATTDHRPQLSEATADELYSIEATLKAGGVYTATYSGSGAGGEAGSPGVEPLGERSVSYESEDDWEPRGAIEDVSKIVPGLLVDPNGDPKQPGVYKTIQSAIGAAVVVAGCPRVFIKVMPGTYREKVTLPAKTSTPPITLYSADRDPSKVVIVSGHSAAGAENDGTPLTIHQSATFTNSLPQPFQARNLTIANDYVAGTYPGEEELQTAVALLTQADKAMFDNVRILGHRNALYIKSTATNEVARAYFTNCYIEGDEDIILGRGTGVIDQCRIHSLGDRVSGGAVTAPSTRIDNPHGLLIINSELTADARVSNVYLGRQWYEGEDQEAVGKAVIRNSILGAHLRSGDVWAPSLRSTPSDPAATDPVVLFTSDDYYAPLTGLVPPEIFLGEFGNSGPGAAP